jgi:RNA polymerase sigma-70 factor (ECF subfamily)
LDKWPWVTHTGSVTSSPRTANDDGPGTGEDLRRSAHGDREAFARVYDRTVAGVYGLVLRMLRDPVRAQEVVRETYLDAWSQAHRYDPCQGSASAWITGLAHRRAVARVRAVGRLTLSDATAEPTRETSPEVRAAWSGLSAQEARALDLTYVRGASFQEAAGFLDVLPSVVTSLLRQGLLRLRDSQAPAA